MYEICNYFKIKIKHNQILNYNKILFIIDATYNICTFILHFNKNIYFNVNFIVFFSKADV